MKQVIFFVLVLQTFVLRAQLPPNLLTPYVPPSELLNKIDTLYVPDSIYIVEVYGFNYLTEKWTKVGYNLVETENYRLTRILEHILNNPGAPFDRLTTQFQYSQDTLTSISYSGRDRNDGTEVPIHIDSFHTTYYPYPSSYTSWGIETDYPYGFNKKADIYYTYDLAGRYTGTTGSDLFPGNPTFDCYYSVDSFHTNGKPFKIAKYGIINGVRQNISFTYYGYDSQNRTNLITSFNPLATDSMEVYTDSIRFYYSGTNTYPDSSLSYSISLPPIAGKQIFMYNANRKIAEIVTYKAYYAGQPLQLAQRDIYSSFKTVGVDKVHKSVSKGFLLYPNPSYNNIQVESINNIPITRCRIIDVQGKEWISKVEDNIKLINVEFLDEGLYCLQVEFYNGERAVNWFIKKSDP